MLKRAIKVSPGDALLWYQLGLAHSSAGRESEAMAAFEKSVALDPDLAEPRNLLGAALAAKGDLDGAQREFLAALQIHPDFPEVLGNLGQLAARRIGGGGFYCAVRSFEAE